MSGAYRVVYVDYEVTVLDGVVSDPLAAIRPTPDGAFSAGLAGLLDRIGPRFNTEGVLVLGGLAARALGLPEDGDSPTILAELDKHGWKCAQISDWSTCYGDDRPKVHVLDTRRVNRADFPLWSDDPMTLVTRLRLWHDLTGFSWRLSPGASGLAIMAGLDKKRSNKGQVSTTWKLKNGDGDGPDTAHEDDYRKGYWSRKPAGTPAPFVHAFDAIRSYIASAMLCEVSPWALTHTGRQEFDKRRAGWWVVELAPWNVAEMPDPAGYLQLNSDDDPRRLVRPLTTQTMTLLEELTAQGVYGGVRILDSWTGPARPYPLREYAQRMDDAYHFGVRGGKQVRTLAYAAVDDADRDAVQRAVKLVGHKTFGALDSPSNWAHRPHMWYSTLALARANLWRKAWKVGQHTGHWPLWIDVDCLYYGSEHEDPDKAAAELTYWDEKRRAQAGILLDPSGYQLGKFTHKGTKRLRRTR